MRIFKFSSTALELPLLIPAKNFENAPQAWERYFRALGQNSDMVDLFQGEPPRIHYQSFSEVSADELSRSPVLMANDPLDYRLGQDQLLGYRALFGSESVHELLLLPVAADLGLTLEESRGLKKRLANEVALLVLMGGDDVHDPKVANISSIDTNPTRDAFEISLIKTFVARKKGFLLGMCRGLQITAVALGYELIQHLPRQMGEEVDHSPRGGGHFIRFLKTTHSYLQNAKVSVLAKVNSLHHQAVRFKKGGPLEVAALGQDGVVEALEFKNGLGLLTQFHPELMRDLFSKNIMRAVLRASGIPSLPSAKSCSKAVL